MFGFRYAKFEPGLYVFRYKKGKLAAQGEGLSFRYHVRTTSLVCVPVGSADVPFMFSETSSDFQELTIQGQLTYRISDASKTAKMLNYTVGAKTLMYISDDPDHLSERLTNMALIAVKAAVKNMPLRDVITASDDVAKNAYQILRETKMVQNLGVDVLSLSIAAIKPSPETSKALEAETRESILKESDQAIFQRRNYAVEQERIIRESELNTEIAVEHKNREIRETKLETERLAQQKQHEMKDEQLKFNIKAEEKNRQLVELRTKNEKTEADSRAYSLKQIMKVYEEMNPEVLKALANAGLDSGRLMALAFQGIADKAEKIGNLNITPDLLATVIKNKT
ncbi:MAG: SPFH domain-containing protein [Treponema sp.]|jgi:regulator of protease activity HflC (stomatin/prohibitin superfamily)|nr:SPFH domain-containing protein [Treponema sp.]